MPIYKFRAEVRSDVFNLLPLIRSEIVDVFFSPEMIDGDTHIRDTEVVLTLKTMSLADLKAEMRKVVDGHVMVETVALKENYTGDRNYESALFESSFFSKN